MVGDVHHPTLYSGGMGAVVFPRSLRLGGAVCGRTVLGGLLDTARWRLQRVETVSDGLTDTVLNLSADASLMIVGDRRQGVV